MSPFTVRTVYIVKESANAGGCPELWMLAYYVKPDSCFLLPEQGFNRVCLRFSGSCLDNEPGNT
jgi:hypothetical protein